MRGKTKIILTDITLLLVALILLGIVMSLISNKVSAVPWSPQDNIDLKSTYNMTNLNFFDAFKMKGNINMMGYNVTNVTDVSVSSMNITGNVTAEEFRGKLNWTSLKEYPTGCPASSAVTTLGDSVTCQDLWVDDTGDSMTGAIRATGYNSTGLINTTELKVYRNTNTTNLYVQNIAFNSSNPYGMIFPPVDGCPILVSGVGSLLSGLCIDTTNGIIGFQSVTTGYLWNVTEIFGNTYARGIFGYYGTGSSFMKGGLNISGGLNVSNLTVYGAFTSPTSINTSTLYVNSIGYSENPYDTNGINIGDIDVESIKMGSGGTGTCIDDAICIDGITLSTSKVYISTSNSKLNATNFTGLVNISENLTVRALCLGSAGCIRNWDLLLINTSPPWIYNQSTVILINETMVNKTIRNIINESIKYTNGSGSKGSWLWNSTNIISFNESMFNTSVDYLINLTDKRSNTSQNYLYNSSQYMSFNDTKLNETIDNRVTGGLSKYSTEPWLYNTTDHYVFNETMVNKTIDNRMLGVGKSSDPDLNYLYNSSTIYYFNETKLNQTILDKTSGSGKLGGLPWVYNTTTYYYFNETMLNYTVGLLINVTDKEVNTSQNYLMNNSFIISFNESKLNETILLNSNNLTNYWNSSDSNTTLTSANRHFVLIPVDIDNSLVFAVGTDPYLTFRTIVGSESVLISTVGDKVMNLTTDRITLYDSNFVGAHNITINGSYNLNIGGGTGEKDIIDLVGMSGTAIRYDFDNNFWKFYYEGGSIAYLTPTGDFLNSGYTSSTNFVGTSTSINTLAGALKIANGLNVSGIANISNISSIYVNTTYLNATNIQATNGYINNLYVSTAFIQTTNFNATRINSTVMNTTNITAVTGYYYGNVTVDYLLFKKNSSHWITSNGTYMQLVVNGGSVINIGS